MNRPEQLITKLVPPPPGQSALYKSATRLPAPRGWHVKKWHCIRRDDWEHTKVCVAFLAEGRREVRYDPRRDAFLLEPHSSDFEECADLYLWAFPRNPVAFGGEWPTQVMP